MTLKTITLTYKGRGVFTTRRKLRLQSDQAVRVFFSPTPWTGATRGALKISARMVKRLLTDTTLSVWNS